MTPAEAAVLLAAISANDNREVTEVGARAWAAALPDVGLQDALDFLPSYYRTATSEGRHWIYPGDVLNGVVAMHKKRRAEVALEARREVMDGAEHDYDAYPIAMKAARDALDEYDAKHQVPAEVTAPRRPELFA